MKNIKLLLTLAVATAGQCYAMENLSEQLPQLKAEVISAAQKIAPAAEQVYVSIQNNDFDGLKQSLNATLGGLNLEQVIAFLQNNLSTVQKTIENVLSQIPAEYQSKFKKVIAEARKQLQNTPALKEQLSVLKSHARIDESKIAMLVDAIKSAKNSPKLAQDIEAIKQSAIKIANAQKFDAIQNSANKIQTIISTVKSGGDVELDEIVAALPGIKNLQELLPAIPALIKSISSFVATIDVNNEIPAQVKEALQELAQNLN